MSEQKHFILYKDPADREYLVKAFKWLATNADNRAVLAIGYKRHLEFMLDGVFSEYQIKELSKNNYLQFEDVRIELITKSSRVYDVRDVPILAIEPDLDFVERISANRSFSKILVIPFTEEDIQPWVRTWNAVLLDSEPTETEDISIHPVVAEALSDIAPSTAKDISHTYDDNRAKWCFELLLKAGYDYDPEHVRIFFLRKGWMPKNAEEVKKIAEAIKKGRTLSKGERPWVPNIIEIWEEKAEEKDS